MPSITWQPEKKEEEIFIVSFADTSSLSQAKIREAIGPHFMLQTHKFLLAKKAKAKKKERKKGKRKLCKQMYLCMSTVFLTVDEASALRAAAMISIYNPVYGLHHARNVEHLDELQIRYPGFVTSVSQILLEN